LLNDLKNTAKHILIYSIGNISTKLVGFILLPLYTDYLSKEEYGTLAILEVTSFMLIALIGLKQSTAMMRWCSAEKDKERVKSIAFTTLITLLILVIVFNILFQPLAGAFGTILFESGEFKSYFRVLFLFISFEILNAWVLDLIRIKGKPSIYVILSLVKFTSTLVLNIYFIKYQGMGVLGIILSQLIGSILLFLLSIVFISKNVKPVIHRGEIRPMFKYGFPLVFTTMSMYLLSLGDRFLMKYMLDLGEVGVYALGYKIATVSNLLVIQSFQIGFLPIAYRMYEKPGNERFFIKTLTYYSFVLVLFSLGISLFSKELITLLARSDEYLLAYTIVPFISLAFVFKGIQYIFSLSLHFVKNTKYNAFIVLGVALFNVLLNIILLPRMGIYGSGLASVISFFIMLIFFRYFARRFFDPGYEVGKLLLMIILGIILYTVSLLFADLSLWINIVLKLVLIVSFPFLLYLLKFYEKVEIDSIKGAVKKWNKPGDLFQNIKDFLNN
jgi:O-antigen/teichoic acid export membrane protein